MLIFGLEALLGLFLVIFIIVYVASGKRKRAARDRRQD
jgi:hypothetical protein